MSTTVARRRGPATRAGGAGNKIWFAAVAGLVILLLIALIATRPSGDSTTDTDLAQNQAVQITGDPLPPVPESGEDPAVGLEAPAVSGKSFDGSPVLIKRGDGLPKVIMLLAHWCPHCQAEVPVIQDWLEAEGMPEGVELLSISTAVDPNQPNYSPSTWLEREGWEVPVLADNELSEAASAFGVTGYPFFVFVNGDGTVAARASGELPIETIEGHIASLK